MHSLQKAARVLGAFDADQPEWGVRALAAELEMPRATVHAYLAGLTGAGLLRRTPAGRYRLSWRLAEMGAQLNISLPWFMAARQLITHLALDIQTVAFLCLLEDTEVVCAIRERHPAADIDMPLDTYLPSTATASGKVLYAYLNMQPPEFTICTPSSISTADEWETELARVRRRGYAYSIEEWLPDQCTLALPYWYGNQVVAAVGIQMTAERYLREERALREQTVQILQQHHATGPH
ncbi:transcriptional regulator, IclR family [Deinococcus proteolyticus MRP]|uniref:Transcriptional regulator, IclR family n=1 Tax=Deinococcus proteolyticus (strain ATCC 35074 / DSM 20540 / JCM 6276 / NBRC 101906 / NCIMB 13154 / VKM Ac-1939 / CCM 2703 / MRP) TaxID=693977 RepID=F0RNR7_DEIPM|nr:MULTISPECIES: IclR family transcriptional regulator [Deinococcus]ADY25300.1 transcriptional regulator, IclR family [Deinococcus proteolyticus MRP]MCY1703401.1 IclR family transcriptional regulator [Deinococcus sp. SL84]